MPEEKRTITLNLLNYKKLVQIKINKTLRTFDEVIEYLCNNQKEVKE